MHKDTFSLAENAFDKLVLFAIYFLFIFSAMLPMSGNAANYVATILILGMLFVYLLMIKDIQNKRYQIVIILSYVILLSVAFYPPVQLETLYFRLFVLKVVLLTMFMSSTKMSVQSFSYVLNLSYLIYLFLSLLVWFKLVPGYDYASVNSFNVNIGSLKFETLFGISGTTAAIDSYSGLIFLWNLFVNKSRYKYILMFISFAALLLTFRNTPIVALILAVIVYFFIRNRVLGIASLVGLVIGFLSVVWLLNSVPDAQVPFLPMDKTWNEFFWAVTHARSSLWAQQFMIYLNDYTWHDYIVGPGLTKLTVPFVKPDGQILHETFNPHNSYLLLLYRSSVTSIILFILFLAYTMKTFSRRTFPLIFFIATSAITNSSLLGLQNPTYLLVILFIFTHTRLQGEYKKGNV